MNPRKPSLRFSLLTIALAGSLSTGCTRSFISSPIQSQGLSSQGLSPPSSYSVTFTKTNLSSVPATSPQTVATGATLALTLTPDSLFALKSTVGGTCPAGSWSGSTYTTAAITGNCSLNFTGIAGATAITTGIFHSCAIVNGGVKCWGYGGFGELGNGATSNSSTAVPVSGLTSNVGALAVGYSHNCVIQSGVVKCWGKNHKAQLGTGTTSSAQSTPLTARPLQ